MAAFNFTGRMSGSGTYADPNGVVWRIFKGPDDGLLDDEQWTAEPVGGPKSKYGVVTQWGPRRTMKQRIDEYAAMFAIAPPAAESSWIVLLMVAAVVLMDEDRRR